MGRLEVRGKEGMHSEGFCVDTVSFSDSFMRWSAVRRHGLKSHLRRLQTFPTAKEGGDHALVVEFELRLTGKGGATTRLKGLYVADVPAPILLGGRIIKELGAVPNLRKGWVEFEVLGVRVPLLRMDQWAAAGVGAIGKRRAPRTRISRDEVAELEKMGDRQGGGARTAAHAVGAIQVRI
jgi:hypothetical protein